MRILSNLTECRKMYKFLLILVALSPLFVSVNAGELYTSEYGNSFYIEKDKMFYWYDAIQKCASRDMSLITPDTMEKNLEITKLLASINFRSVMWTSGQVTENHTFVWNTTGNIVTYNKWNSGEPKWKSTSCIYFRNGGWGNDMCNTVAHVMCEESSLVKEKIRDLDILNTKQSPELNKMKSYYENETNIKLEELKQSCRNETQELAKVNLEALHALKNEMKIYYENETNSKLEELHELMKLHENDTNNLLEEKQRQISVLKTDLEKQLNQFNQTLVNTIQEIEQRLKLLHAKELPIQEEQQNNYALNSSNNRTGVNKTYNVQINVHGNRN